MAFQGIATFAQSANPLQIVVTDASTGSDGNLVTRSILLYKIDGTLLTGAAISWPYTDGSTKTITIDKDYSFTAIVTWTSSSPLPSPSTYTQTTIETFEGNTQSFSYEMVQQMQAQPNIVDDTLFYQSLLAVQVETNNAENSDYYDDNFNAQASLDRALYFINNRQKFF